MSLKRPRCPQSICIFKVKSLPTSLHHSTSQSHHHQQQAPKSCQRMTTTSNGRSPGAAIGNESIDLHHRHHHHRHPDGDMPLLLPATQILPWLYLGDEKDANDQELLKAHNIGYILSIASDPRALKLSQSTCSSSSSSSSSSTSSPNSTPSTPPSSPSSPPGSPVSPGSSPPRRTCPNFFASRDIKVKLISADDSCQQNLIQFFEEAFNFIDEAKLAGKSILVHCAAGISRSATIIIGYLMRSQSMTLIDAYTEVKSKRPIISPNLNFMGQLVELERSLSSKGSSSTSSSTHSELND